MHYYNPNYMPSAPTIAFLGSQYRPSTPPHAVIEIQPCVSYIHPYAHY